MRNRFIILATLAITALAGAAGADRTPVIDENDAAQLRRAIDNLERGNLSEAERESSAFVDSPEPFGSKAILIRARARQLLQKYDQACQDYSSFLNRRPSLLIRRYVEDQLAMCQNATPTSAPAEAPKTLSLNDGDVAKLSRVREKREVFQTLNFFVQSSTRELSECIARQAERELTRIQKELYPNLQIKRKIRIEIHPDRQTYDLAAGQSGPWSAGLAIHDPKSKNEMGVVHLVQNDSSGVLDIQTLRHALPHEITHLLTAEFFASAPAATPCPLFLDEGIALLCDGMNRDEMVHIAAISLTADKAEIPLLQLVEMKEVPENQRLLFYAKSASLVDLLRSRLSTEQFSSFLRNIRGGMTFYKSLAAALRMTDESSLSEMFEPAWREFAVTQMQLSKILNGPNAGKERTNDGEKPTAFSGQKS